MTGTLRSVDPATGDEVASYPAFTTAEIEAAVAAADQAQRAWRGVSLDERARRLREAARLLRERREEYATLLTREMGKPIVEARAEAVAEQAARSRFLNSGQSCLAAKRFVVEEPVSDEFEGRFVAATEALPVGNPLDPATRVGPLARADLVDGLDRQVRESVARGARVLTGGKRIGEVGCFYAPTVLGDVRPGMPAYDEETFGPVAAVIRAADEDQAVRVANDTAYGLGASVWTRDVERGRRVARQVQSGAVFVNAVVASDPRLPFGGVKRSGYGRELSAAGIREFTNLRTWWVSGSATPDPGAALTE
jgi:succinate-semialdehyde dehydrogenase / glutarate-semialdehyde dehydrogenase